MKEFKNHQRYQLCYDHDCPLCVWYSGYFQRHGYLKPGEAVPFHACSSHQLSLLDAAKMTDEIPLINRLTGDILYGPDAMLEIIGLRHPVFAKLANTRCIRPFINFMYKLVSYNRKVIVGKTPSMAGKNCTPSFQFGYRIIFICLLLIISGLLLALAMSLTSFLWSSNLICGAYLAALAGSFWFISRKQPLPKHHNIERAGQVGMLLMFACFGILVSSGVFLFTANPSAAIICSLAWYVFMMQPQLFRRLNYIVYLQHAPSKSFD